MIRSYFTKPFLAGISLLLFIHCSRGHHDTSEDEVSRQENIEREGRVKPAPVTESLSEEVMDTIYQDIGNQDTGNEAAAGESPPVMNIEAKTKVNLQRVKSLKQKTKALQEDPHDGTRHEDLEGPETENHHRGGTVITTNN